jgi:hypothetical protein
MSKRDNLEALALMFLALYIGKDNLLATPWWRKISQATTPTPIGPLQGGVGPYLYGLPQH